MLVGMSCVYGQSVMSDIDFISSASIVYLGSNPNLYLSDAKVRFYVSSKPEYRFEEENMSEGVNLIVPIMYQRGKTYVRISSNQVSGKGITGWLDKKERADAFRRGVENTLGRALGWMLRGR